MMVELPTDSAPFSANRSCTPMPGADPLIAWVDILVVELEGVKAESKFCFVMLKYTTLVPPDESSDIPG